MDGRLYNAQDNSKPALMPPTDLEPEDSFFKAFHLSTILKFIIDCQTMQFVDINQVWLATMGWERHEVIGRTPMDLDIFEDGTQYQELAATIQRKQASSKRELGIRTKSGQILTTVTGVDYINLQGRLCILGETFDITERKNAELALQQSEEKFHKAFNNSFSVQLLSRLHDGLIVEANDACCEAFGIDKADIIGMKSAEIGIWMDPHDRPAVVARLLMRGEYHEPNWHYRAGGENRCGIVNLKLIQLSGEPHILTDLIDITERRLSEEALRESEERFYKAFHNSPVIMAIYDAESKKQIEINQMYSSVLGYSPEEAVGKTTGDLGLWEDFMQKQAFIRLLDSQDRVENFEAQLLTKHGSRKTVLIQVQTIHLNGRRCYLNSMIDITDLKRMEQEINRLDRLHLVGEMAASLGHEIRNPMTSVRGFLQLMGETEPLEAYKTYFDLMIEEMDRANEIVTSFLSMSTNKYISPQLEDLNHTISGIYPLIQADAIRTDKSVILDLKPLPKVMIDNNEIRQLIINLARNGLESMPGHGVLTIGSYLRDGQAVLYVRDQGAGIDPEVMGKLGTPFTTTKEDGLGIGLAVCYSIAARHQAEIAVETGLDGTTFLVKFDVPE